MVDKESVLQTKFHSFLKQRNSKTNVAMQEAQRLVNLYRVLNDFGPDFVDEYNVMLKNASDEVQMALKALVGGQEVRQYLEFLLSEEHKEQTENESGSSKQQTGWLPSPEEETTDDDSGNGSGISPHVLQEFVKQQDEKLAQIVSELRAEQTAALNRMMDQLSSSLRAQKTPPSAPTPKPIQPEYSEIIEDKR